MLLLFRCTQKSITLKSISFTLCSQGDASQKETEIDEELNLSGSGEIEDKEALEEENGNDQDTATEQNEINDDTEENSSEGSKKKGEIPS